MEKRNFSFVESKKFVEVQMNPLKTESKVKAMVSVQFYELNGDKKGKFTNSFSGLKLIEVKKGEFILAEPGNNYKDNAGEWVNSPGYILSLPLKKLLLKQINDSMSKK